MDYHLHHQGRELGTASLEDLQARRASGELTGNELVWREGMTEWQALDQVLGIFTPQAPPQLPASPVSAPASPVRTPSRYSRGAVFWIATSVLVTLAVVVGVVMVVTNTFRQELPSPVKQTRRIEPSRAAQPIPRSTNALTVDVVRGRTREFLMRQWVEGYKERGERNHLRDADGLALIQTWIEVNYGRTTTNSPNLSQLAERIVNTVGVGDPMLLTVAAFVTDDAQKKIELLERALKGYEDSAHLAYPRLAAVIALLEATEFPDERNQLIGTALRSFFNCLSDGSITPDDQAEIGEIFVHGWGREFSGRIPFALGNTARTKPEFSWLANVLEGNSHINFAWRFRGSGYAHTVTETGWAKFREHLAAARTNLVAAWTERPDLPLAPGRMINVSMGDTGGKDMRLWFDRTIAAQVDYPSAWSDMRWGLRPRWHGDIESMLAFGKMAVETGRFDTDVPRKLIDSIQDVESEMELPLGEHIIGRADIWPFVARMYEGYIAHGNPDHRQGWRSAYSVVSYLGGHYDISTTNLESLDWKTRYRNLHGWGRDLSIYALEAAARTGPLGSRITEAEVLAGRNDAAGALGVYESIQGQAEAAEMENRTRRFIEYRRRTLQLESRLQTGEWVSLLPETNDLAWNSIAGVRRVAADNSMEIDSGANGHLILCRARVGRAFEVKGTFEIVKSPETGFEAGVGFGKPSWEDPTWYSFRVTQTKEREVAGNFARGWSYIPIVNRPASLKDGANDFHFSFRDSRLTASVNGTEVMKDFAVPESSRLNIGQHTIAFTGATSAGTIIRYRSLHVRQLKTP